VNRGTIWGHEIYIYDGSALDFLSDLSDEYFSNMLPQINNRGDVVWQAYSLTSIVPGESEAGSDMEIFLYKNSPDIVAQFMEGPGEDEFTIIEDLYPIIDLTGGIIQITDNDCEDNNPQINNNGLVVWWGGHQIEDWMDPDGTDESPDSEIFLYDSATGTTTQLTNNDYDDWFPQISGLDYAVWMGNDGNDWEIYLYDHAAGTITQLTNNSYDDEFPQIRAHFVVWQGKMDGQYEIFRATIVSEENSSDTGDEGETADGSDSGDTGGGGG
jgi:hypothetical protein